MHEALTHPKILRDVAKKMSAKDAIHFASTSRAMHSPVMHTVRTHQHADFKEKVKVLNTLMTKFIDSLDKVVLQNLVQPFNQLSWTYKVELTILLKDFYIRITARNDDGEISSSVHIKTSNGGEVDASQLKASSMIAILNGMVKTNISVMGLEEMKLEFDVSLENYVNGEEDENGEFDVLHEIHQHIKKERNGPVKKNAIGRRNINTVVPDLQSCLTTIDKAAYPHMHKVASQLYASIDAIRAFHIKH